MTVTEKTKEEVERNIPQNCIAWSLGGYWYYSKKKVGAGLRAKYNQNMMRAILESDQSSKVLDLIMKMSSKNSNRPVDPRIKDLPDHLKEEAEKTMLEKTLVEEYDTVMKSFMLGQIYTYRLVLLESVLTPCSGSPSVQEAYDEAEEEEVVAIENFFGQKQTDKTNSEIITPLDSAENNETVISHNTSEMSETTFHQIS